MTTAITSHTCNLCFSNKISTMFEKNNYHFNKCENCGIIYINPMPNETELVKLYNDPSKAIYYEKATQEGIIYAEKVKSGLFKDLKAINFNSWKRILDIGCGGGFLLNSVKKEFDELHGLEVSMELVRFAKSKWSLNVHHGEIQNVNLPENYFDIVTLYDVIEHIPKPLIFLDAIYRILKHNGVIVIVTPNANGLSARIMKEKWIYYTPPEHIFYYTPKSIKVLLKTKGFKICKVKTENLYINHISMQKCYRDVNLKELRVSTSDVSKYINKYLILRGVKALINKILETHFIGDNLVCYAKK